MFVRLLEIDLEVIVVNTTNPLLGIPAFYQLYPGAHFRERAMGTGMGMFSAKLIAENSSPQEAVRVLKEIETLFPEGIISNSISDQAASR